MLESLSQVGELVGGIGALAALGYLAVQIRHSYSAARAQSRQTLLDTYADLAWQMSLDRDLARTIAVGITRWPDISSADKTAFDLSMGRFLANLNNGLLLVDAGMLDQEIFDEIGDNMLMSVQMSGGARWWRDTRAASRRVRKYIDARLALPETLPERSDQAFPHWIALAEAD